MFHSLSWVHKMLMFTFLGNFLESNSHTNVPVSPNHHFVEGMFGQTNCQCKNWNPSIETTILKHPFYKTTPLKTWMFQVVPGRIQLDSFTFFLKNKQMNILTPISLLDTHTHTSHASQLPSWDVCFGTPGMPPPHKNYKGLVRGYTTTIVLWPAHGIWGGKRASFFKPWNGYLEVEQPDP